MESRQVFDKKRQDFERAYAELHDMPLIDFDQYRMGDTYRLPLIAKCWRFWCSTWDASREAVVVELPDRPYASEADQEQMTDYEIGIGHGGCEQWDKIRDQIKAQGLKVNP